MIASAAEPAKPALLVAEHEQAEDEDPDHDRRDAVDHVERKPDDRRQPARRELGHVDRDQDSARKRHRRRQGNEDRAADEGVCEAPAGLAVRDRRLRQKIEVDRPGTPLGNGADHEREHTDREERRNDCKRLP